MYEKEPKSLLEKPFYIPSRDKDLDTPAMRDVWSASFAQENLAGSIAGYGIGIRESQGEVDPEFNKFDHVPRDILEMEYGNAYWWAKTKEDVEYITERLRKQLRDKQTIQAAGPDSLLPLLSAGLTDPTNIPFLFIPAGMAAKKGAGALRTAASIAGEATLGVGLQEAALRQTQEARTWQESAANIGGGAFLSAILGGAMGALGSKWQGIGDSIKSEILTGKKTYFGETLMGGRGRFLTASEAADQALERGFITPEMHTTLKTMVEGREDIDATTALTFHSQEKTMVTPGAGLATAAGEFDYQQFPNTAINFYKGANVDTIVHEFLHDFFLRLPKEDQTAFTRYHLETGGENSKKAIFERFADEGVAYFLAEQAEGKLGKTLSEIFEDAQDTFTAIIGQVQTFRGQSIPESIIKLYKRAVDPETQRLHRQQADQAKAEARTVTRQMQAEATERERQAIEQRRSALESKTTIELKQIAKAMGLPVRKRGKKQLINNIMEIEKRVGPDPRPGREMVSDQEADDLVERFGPEQGEEYIGLLY